jgi:hypothetical protein
MPKARRAVDLYGVRDRAGDEPPPRRPRHLPEIVPRKWWEHLLHNKTALFIRTAFLFKPNVVVTAVPYLLGRAARLSDRVRHDEFLDGEAQEREVLASTGASPPYVVRAGGD